MDLFEKINRSFGTWYEGLFGNTGDDVRPKDILRRIFTAMEDYRKEHFDNRVYVPNQYILEISVNDEEEKEYLLSFINREELASAIKRYCQQNHYHIRGALDVTIKEVDVGEMEAGGKGREKVRVRCCYSTKVADPAATLAPAPLAGFPQNSIEERTVASVNAFAEGGEEEGTVPAVTSAALIVYAPDRPPFRYPITRASVTIGRSPRVGNEIVIESDGQISKRHSRLEMDGDGHITLYDLGSTNGTKVNGRRVENRTLNDGDEILLGVTRLTFQQSRNEAESMERSLPESRATVASTTGVASPFGQGTYGGAVAALRAEEASGGSSVPPTRVLRPRTARLILMDRGQDLDDFLLASETLIGRGVTNDIVLPDRSIATRHARIVREDAGYALEALSDSEPTLLNGHSVAAHDSMPLMDGDRIGLGVLLLRFEAGQ